MSADLIRVIWQVGQLVHDDVRLEVTNRLDECLPVEDVAEDRLGTEVVQQLDLAEGARHAADDVTGVDQARNEALTDHTGRAGEEDSLTWGGHGMPAFVEGQSHASASRALRLVRTCAARLMSARSTATALYQTTVGTTPSGPAR